MRYVSNGIWQPSNEQTQFISFDDQALNAATFEGIHILL